MLGVSLMRQWPGMWWICRERRICAEKFFVTVDCWFLRWTPSSFLGEGSCWSIWIRWQWVQKADILCILVFLIILRVCYSACAAGKRLWKIENAVSRLHWNAIWPSIQGYLKYFTITIDSFLFYKSANVLILVENLERTAGSARWRRSNS